MPQKKAVIPKNCFVTLNPKIENSIDGQKSSRRFRSTGFHLVSCGQDESLVIRISREYPGILEGVNTWLMGINKEDRQLDISFFVREKDYRKIINKEMEYRRDIFGRKLYELKSIPFFGLRNFDAKAGEIMLFSDIWKYHYPFWIFIVFLLAPQLFIVLMKKCGYTTMEDKSDTKSYKWIDYIFWTLLLINFISFII